MIKGNWKTTAAGIGAILTVIGQLLSNGFQFDPSMIAAIITGVGLITAKDAANKG